MDSNKQTTAFLVGQHWEIPTLAPIKVDTGEKMFRETNLLHILYRGVSHAQFFDIEIGCYVSVLHFG
jgi:hypothetical protein